MSDQQSPTLASILTGLLAILTSLAASTTPPVDIGMERWQAEKAQSSGVEPQLFRAVEVLLWTAHGTGLTEKQELLTNSSYKEAVRALQMSGRELPPGLPYVP